MVMNKFKAGDKVEFFPLYGNAVVVGTILNANELDDVYHLVYKEEKEEWVSKADMKLLDTPKTADEMLVELGYTKDTEDEWEARYYRQERCLLFNKKCKSVEKFYSSQGYAVSMLPDEIKAVYKKEEELGWL